MISLSYIRCSEVIVGHDKSWIAVECMYGDHPALSEQPLCGWFIAHTLDSYYPYTPPYRWLTHTSPMIVDKVTIYVCTYVIDMNVRISINQLCMYVCIYVCRCGHRRRPRRLQLQLLRRKLRSGCRSYNQSWLTIVLHIWSCNLLLSFLYFKQPLCCWVIARIFDNYRHSIMTSSLTT